MKITISCLTLFLLLVFGISKPSQASDDKLLLIPDHFEISENLNRPQFNIVPTENGHRVSIKYEVSTEGLEEYLFQKYGEDTFKKDIFKAEILPVSIRHISEIFNAENLIVRSWSASFKLNEIHLVYDFTNEFSKEQINNIFLFPFLFASVNAEIHCSGQIVSSVCNSVIEELPLYNQYRLESDPALRTRLNDHYLINHYINFVTIGNPLLKLSDAQALDKYFQLKLFQNNKCRRSLNDEEKKVCALIEAHSSAKSITETRFSLSSLLWPVANINARHDFFILGTQDFSVTTGDSSNDSSSSAEFENDGIISMLKEENCYKLTEAFVDLIDSRVSPTPYRLSRSNVRCSVLASAPNFIDLKFAEDRSVTVEDQHWGIGMDAIFRITRTSCHSEIFNIEGSTADNEYTLPPTTYFPCVGTNTDSTHCDYSHEERKKFDLVCTNVVKEIFR